MKKKEKSKLINQVIKKVGCKHLINNIYKVIDNPIAAK